MSYNALHERLKSAVDSFCFQRRGSALNAENAELWLASGIERLQGCVWLRRFFLFLMVTGLLLAMLYFVWGLLPRYYTLRISGGDILSNRHQMAMLLRNEAEKSNLNLVVQPISGSLSVLEAVNRGDLDVALVQGGLDMPLPNVRHVTSLMSETVHLLARNEITEIAHLKGRSINLGSKHGGTRVAGHSILSFSELESGVDYVETAYSAEELISLPEHKMPDAILLVSTVPSFLAEELIRVRGYHLLEIPFPASLALRFGWVADANILAYTYKIQPPIPPKNLETLGINLFIICNKNTPDKAIVQLLDVLFSASMGSALRHPLNPALITRSSGYPLSGGSEKFMSRREPFFSQEMVDKFKSAIGLLMSGLTMLMIGVRWLTRRSGRAFMLAEDAKTLISCLGGITSDLAATMAQKPMPADMRVLFHALCAQLRLTIAERWISTRGADSNMQALTLDSLRTLERRLEAAELAHRATPAHADFVVNTKV